MQKARATLGNILVIILLVLSCFGLLMFLWESFGGPLPLKPKGYRFSVAFQRTLALARTVRRAHQRRERRPCHRAEALGSDGRTHATIEVLGPIRPDSRGHACDPAARRRCSERPSCS